MASEKTILEVRINVEEGTSGTSSLPPRTDETETSKSRKIAETSERAIKQATDKNATLDASVTKTLDNSSPENRHSSLSDKSVEDVPISTTTSKATGIQPEETIGPTAVSPIVPAQPAEPISAATSANKKSYAEELNRTVLSELDTRTKFRQPYTDTDVRETIEQFNAVMRARGREAEIPSNPHGEVSKSVWESIDVYESMRKENLSTYSIVPTNPQAVQAMRNAPEPVFQTVRSTRAGVNEFVPFSQAPIPESVRPVSPSESEAPRPVPATQKESPVPTRSGTPETIVPDTPPPPPPPLHPPIVPDTPPPPPPPITPVASEGGYSTTPSIPVHSGITSMGTASSSGGSGGSSGGGSGGSSGGSGGASGSSSGATPTPIPSSSFVPISSFTGTIVAIGGIAIAAKVTKDVLDRMVAEGIEPVSREFAKLIPVLGSVIDSFEAVDKRYKRDMGIYGNVNPYLNAQTTRLALQTSFQDWRRSEARGESFSGSGAQFGIGAIGAMAGFPVAAAATNALSATVERLATSMNPSFRGNMNLRELLSERQKTNFQWDTTNKNLEANFSKVIYTAVNPMSQRLADLFAIAERLSAPLFSLTQKGVEFFNRVMPIFIPILTMIDVVIEAGRKWGLLKDGKPPELDDLRMALYDEKDENDDVRVQRRGWQIPLQNNAGLPPGK